MEKIWLVSISKIHQTRKYQLSNVLFYKKQVFMNCFINSFVRSDREISELVLQPSSPIIVNVGSSPVGNITPRTAYQLEAAHVAIFSSIQRMKLYFKSKYVVSLSNLGIIVSSQNFGIIVIRRCWFQIWQYCFQIPA